MKETSRFWEISDQSLGPIQY